MATAQNVQAGAALVGGIAGMYSGGASVAAGASGGGMGGLYSADGGNQGPQYGGEASSATHGVLDGSNWSVNFRGTQIATPTSSNYTAEGLPAGTSAAAAMVAPLTAGGSSVLYIALGLVALGLVARATKGRR